MRLYRFLQPSVVAILLRATSKIHISFDRRTTKGGRCGFCGIVTHFADESVVIGDLLSNLPQLQGSHAGDRIASSTIDEAIGACVDGDSADGVASGEFER
jgi:hypothetical protein